MRITKITATKGFEREFSGIATDKSISHRSVIFALLANASCRVENYLMGEDTLHTLHIARELGLGDYIIMGKGSLKNGEQNRNSILADAFDALLSH